MQDPRDLALQTQHDLHSHNNAIHVAFARLYQRAVPNARIAAYYDSRLPAVQEWAAARIARENELETCGRGAQEEHVPDPPRVEIVEEKPKEKAKPREQAKPILGKRKPTAATKTAAPPAPRTTRSKQRRTEVERLRISSGQVSAPPVPAPAPARAITLSSGSSSSFSDDDEALPPAHAPAPAEPKKARHTPAPNTKTKRAPKTASAPPTAKQTPSREDYEILPYVAGMTEVIVNRYPLPRRKRGGDDAAGATLDTARLGLMCMKAAGQKRAVKAGAENSAPGGVGDLVFLRRNKLRVKKRLGLGVLRK